MKLFRSVEDSRKFCVSFWNLRIWTTYGMRACCVYCVLIVVCANAVALEVDDKVPRLIQLRIGSGSRDAGA